MPDHSDIGTTIISALALLLSSLSFYNQFLKKTYKVIYANGGRGTINKNSPLNFEIVLCNAGNTEVLITEFMFWFPQKMDGQKHGALPDIINDELPILLKPGAITLMKIKSDIDFRGNDWAYERKPEYIKFITELSLTSILSNGKKILSTFEIATLTYNNDQNKSLGFGFGKETMGINILSKKHSHKTY